MRFQNLWAVRQVLNVLAAELRSVRIEPAGLEGEGVDLLVTALDKSIEYQQCKRSYRQAGKWTLKVLAIAKKADRSKSSWEAEYYLAPVLLRLYEQAPEGDDVREQSLNAWDLLLEARVASAVSLTKDLEIES